MMRRTTDAAVFARPGAEPEIQTLLIEEPRATEVLVRLKACGVCHTDMVLRDGSLPLTFPAVLGHEGAGIVEAVGAEVAGLRPGDKVVLSFMSCRACATCTTGHPSYCENIASLNFSGRRPDGSPKLWSEDGQPISGSVFGQSSFSHLALAHRENVVRVETDLPFHMLAPLGCGVQTGAGTVLETLRVTAGSTVAILGGGGVGLAAAMAAIAVGASAVTVLDRHEGRRRLARALGATAAVAEAGTLPDGLDFIIDTTGIADVAAQAASHLGICGTLALVGAHAKRDILQIEAAFLVRAGRRVIGVIEGGVDPHIFIPHMIGMIEDGQLPVGRLIQNYAFNEIAQALADSESGKTVKPVLLFD
jgi:aryl-alcohol dehydrogenase